MHKISNIANLLRRDTPRFSRPLSREDFDVAILCALKLEFDASAHLFDDFWDKDDCPYGKAPGDANTYMTGRIGVHNVVLVLLPGMGKVNAAKAAAGITISYSGVRLALVVGICAGLPRDGKGRDTFLGDVIISESIVQHDLGRLYPDGYERKQGILESLGRPALEILSFVKTLQTDIYLERLKTQTMAYITDLQKSIRVSRDKDLEPHGTKVYEYPGAAEDKLFEPNYPHTHHSGCDICHQSTIACEKSRQLSCQELECDERRLERQRRFNDNEAWTPGIHFGAIASGDIVIKSAKDRDQKAKDTGAIAFEMEGAGVWDSIPCIVVKGVCDYADSHKNKQWQTFAAATAACTAKSLLGLATLPQKALPPIATRNLPLIKGNNTMGDAQQTNNITATHGYILNNSAEGSGQQVNYIGPPPSKSCVIQ